MSEWRGEDGMLTLANPNGRLVRENGCEVMPSGRMAREMFNEPNSRLAILERNSYLVVGKRMSRR